MRNLAERFDIWAARGPFTPADLGGYRIIYALLALLTFPRIQYLSDYPASLYAPPPGPFLLLGGLPPRPALAALELLTVAALALLLVGYRTRIASISVAVLLTVSFGLAYSFGKIDHTVLMVAVPIVLAFSNWGDRFSVDSLQGRQRGVQQWPLRLLALLVGLGFLTAAAPKVLTGWLDVSTQATQGHFLTKYLFEGKDNWLAPIAYDVRPGWVWEPLDWLTVALEAGLVLTVLNWRAFRVALAVTCLFHVGVLLLFNIAFNTNVMAYAAFVSWGILIAPIARRFGSPSPREAFRAAWLIGIVAGTFAYLLPVAIGTSGRLVITTTIVLVGGVISAAYLTVQLRHFAQRRSRAKHSMPSAAS